MLGDRLIQGFLRGPEEKTKRNTCSVFLIRDRLKEVKSLDLERGSQRVRLSVPGNVTFPLEEL